MNLKVMFSFVKGHPDFAQTEARRCDFLLWRNPRARVVSTFFDKCREAIRSQPEVTQNAQRVLLKATGRSSVTDLLQMSFDQFVAVLPAIYLEDAHFRPQLHRLRRAQVRWVIDIDQDLDDLGQRLGIDFSRRVNHTAHDEPGTYFDEQTDAVIARLYAKDFLASRYRLGSSRPRWFWRDW